MDVVGAVRARVAGALEPGPPVVVMLSGGRDSTALLDAAVALGRHVTALHVNYRLREGSDGDERACRALAVALDVALEVHRAPPAPARGNLHAWAREHRYAVAFGAAEARGAILASAHTASDQAETVLHRLAASPGRRALMGMPARRGALVRPLLEVTRAQTTAYCAARGLAFREDPSNRDPRFTRARVREGLLASLEDLHPGAAANLARTARELRDEHEVLDELVRRELAGAGEIEAARLAEMHPGLARLVLDFLSRAAGGPRLGGRLEEVLALGRGPGSRTLDVGRGVRAVSEYGVLSVRSGAPVPAPAAVALPVPGRARMGEWEVSSAPAWAGDAGARRAVVAASALADGAAVRPWRPGDRMRPAGLGGSRAVSDLLGERRVPRASRPTFPLVEAGETIVWIPGVAVAEGARRPPGAPDAVALSARRVRP